MNVYGEGWWGGIFRTGPPPSGSKTDLPFGPYIAACLAAAEVFKLARMPASETTRTERAFYSLWNYKQGMSPDTSGPASVKTLTVRDSLLAGIGAVGSAALHCLWATNLSGELLVADNDPNGIDSTNLNRYPLFGTSSLGRPKASSASEFFESGPLHLVPHDGGFEFFFRSGCNRPHIVLSAVDKNVARASIQDQYVPITISAATSDLRAELLRCGPPGLGACLRCFNPPESAPTDNEVRTTLGATPDGIDRIAESLHLPIGEVREWVETGKCGETGDRLLAVLRRSITDPERFAVGFVSAAAGAMIAAQFVKELLDEERVLNSSVNRAVLQFWNPLAETNRASFYPRDASCPKCSPADPATGIWKTRYEEAHRTR